MAVEAGYMIAPANIRPTGMKQGDMVDALYQIVASIAGLCAKLDANANVPLNTYLANCYTAIFNVIIEDQKGNRTGQRLADQNFCIITPTGVSDKAMIELIYQIFNSLETLTEQLDADVLTDSNYEALCYTATMLQMVTNQLGQTLGNDSGFYFNPGGVMNQAQIVEFLYNTIYSISLLTAKLDADATVNEATHTSLWYTPIFTTSVENKKRERIPTA